MVSYPSLNQSQLLTSVQGIRLACPSYWCYFTDPAIRGQVD
jgi:hypothetical protein